MGLLDTLTDPIAAALGVATSNSNTSLVVAQTSIVVASNTNTGIKLDDDQEFARQQLYDVVQKTSNAIGELMMISSSSQHPRAYEVLEKLLMRQQDAASKLLEIHKARAEINKIANTPTGNVNQTYIANAVFTGTVADLLDQIRGKNREVIEHDDLLELEAEANT